MSSLPVLFAAARASALNILFPTQTGNELCIYIYYVYIMYVLCIYYVCIMYILCIYYVYIMYNIYIYILLGIIEPQMQMLIRNAIFAPIDVQP